MPFVERDANGTIIAVHAGSTPVAREELPLGHRDLIDSWPRATPATRFASACSPAISTWRASPKT